MSKLAHSNQETMNKIESQSCKYQDIEDIVVAVIDSNVESVAFKETVGHCAREIIAAIYAHSETDAQPVPVEALTHVIVDGPDGSDYVGKLRKPLYPQSVIDSLQSALAEKVEPIEWLECQDFYEVCQSYRHAKDCVSSNGMPTAAEAFANLKNYIASNTAPASQWRSNELKMHDPEGQHYAGEKLDALQEGDS